MTWWRPRAGKAPGGVAPTGAPGSTAPTGDAAPVADPVAGDDREGPVLRVEGLAVRYRGAGSGLERGSLQARAAEVTCLIGPNGAGKTSTLRAIAGFGAGDMGYVAAGKIVYRGRDITRAAVRDRLDRGIVFVPERDKVFATLTCYEQLHLAMRTNRHPSRDGLEQVLSYFPALKPRLHGKAGFLSGGERQMLAIGCALCASPRVLLIDELSQGLSPGFSMSFCETLREIASRGVAVLLSEQNVRLATTLAHQIYVLDAGRIVAEGSPGELSVRGDIAAAYLGATATAEEANA